MVHVIQPTVIPSPAIVKSQFRIYGEVEILIKQALTGETKLVYKGPNTIHNALKRKVSDAMNLNIDFALDNLQAVQIAKASLSATVNGKDALFIHVNAGPTLYLHSTIMAMMKSVVHPSDAFGDFYRQWQGTYQNLTGAPEITGGASIGQSYTHDPTDTLGIDNYLSVPYATSAFVDVTLAVNDIMTFNWKVSSG